MDLKKELNTKSPQCQAGIWVINFILKPFLCSHLKRERKLLFRPDQQYSRSARLVSCIGINVFHNQNIHFDKRKQIAEIWNYSYRNVVYTTNTFYPLFVDDNVYSVHCTVHPKILEIYTCMHAPCIFLAHSWLTTVVYSKFQMFWSDRARVQDSKYPMRERSKNCWPEYFSLSCSCGIYFSFQIQNSTFLLTLVFTLSCLY